MKDSISNVYYTVKTDLCLGCGICSDVCPTNSINIHLANGEYFPVVDDDTCMNKKGCHRCADVCPGLGVSIKQIATDKFGKQDDIRHHKLVGLYTCSYSGYAIDYETRYHGASGGLLTAFIAFLLDKGYISAAVVAENDLSQPFLNKTVLIHSSKELYKTRSSKYCPVKFESIIRQVKDEVGSVVIVGLPCIMHGYRKYEQKDQKFREKVFGYLGLYCSGGRTFNLTEYIFKKNNIDKSKLSYFQYRDEGCLGSMVARQYQDFHSNSETALYKKIVYKEQFQNYYLPLRSIFIPNRCLFCIDHYAELADISIGDIQYGKYRDDKIGVNSVVVRNIKFKSLLQDAQKNGYIHIEPLSDEILIRCQESAIKKKGRAGGVIRFVKALGKTVPKYDVVLTNYVYWKSIAYYLFAKSQMFVGKRKWLWWFIPIMEKRIHDKKRR